MMKGLYVVCGVFGLPEGVFMNVGLPAVVSVEKQFIVFIVNLVIKHWFVRQSVFCLPFFMVDSI